MSDSHDANAYDQNAAQMITFARLPRVARSARLSDMSHLGITRLRRQIRRGVRDARQRARACRGVLSRAVRCARTFMRKMFMWLRYVDARSCLFAISDDAAP